MKSIYRTIIRPEGERYNNDVDDLIVNASINQADFKYVNRVGIVVEAPRFDPKVKVGDRVLVHHNVFRQYWGFSTHLRTSSSDLDDGTFMVDPDSLYAYDRGDGWIPLDDYIFVEPIQAPESDLILSLESDTKRIGKFIYGSLNGLKRGDTVSYTPWSEHLFEFDGMKLYKMRKQDITSKII